MRGEDRRSEGLFSYVGLEARIPADHPLRGFRPLHPLEKLGVWDGVFETLASLGPPADEDNTIDSTIRVGPSACRRRKRGKHDREALGRSRGGFSTKIHLCTNAKGDVLTFEPTGGEAREVKGYEALMKRHDVDPDRLLGDKGYDRDDIRADLAKRGLKPVIPPRSNGMVAID